MALLKLCGTLVTLTGGTFATSGTFVTLKGGTFAISGTFHTSGTFVTFSGGNFVTWCRSCNILNHALWLIFIQLHS